MQNRHGRAMLLIRIGCMVQAFKMYSSSDKFVPGTHRDWYRFQRDLLSRSRGTYAGLRSLYSALVRIIGGSYYARLNFTIHVNLDPHLVICDAEPRYDLHYPTFLRSYAYDPSLTAQRKHHQHAILLIKWGITRTKSARSSRLTN